MAREIGRLNLEAEAHPWLFQSGLNGLLSQDVVVIRLFRQLQAETERLKKRICQNMSTDLEKHIEAHRILRKTRYSNVFSRSIP